LVTALCSCQSVGSIDGTEIVHGFIELSFGLRINFLNPSLLLHSGFRQKASVIEQGLQL